MKFIQLHSIEDNSSFYLNMQNVEKMEWIDTNDGYTAIKMMNEVMYYCKETTIEILQKIDEAEFVVKTNDSGMGVGFENLITRCKDCKNLQLEYKGKYIATCGNVGLGIVCPKIMEAEQSK